MALTRENIAAAREAINQYNVFTTNNITYIRQDYKAFTNDVNYTAWVQHTVVGAKFGEIMSTFDKVSTDLEKEANSLFERIENYLDMQEEINESKGA